LSTAIIEEVPVKLYRTNLNLVPEDLSLPRKVIAALFAGELARLGEIVRVAPPEVTVTAAVIVYTFSTPAILKVSPC
jgi:hypothetical protein